MQTSNFSKSSLDPNAVSIALDPPFYYHGRCYPELAPPAHLLKSHHAHYDEKYYIEVYTREVLDKLDPQTVYDELGPDAILLCYENGTKFCHRFLVAEWLRKHLGIDILEVQTRYKPQPG